MILTATSGDTGAAVAQAFWKRPGVRAVVLYPKGRVSALQERQFATLGENVNVTASVTDAETPVNQLTYEWSSNVGGTFGANASTTTWTAPATHRTKRR